MGGHRINNTCTVGLFAMPGTLSCVTHLKNSAAVSLMVKKMQLILVLSWGFQPPYAVVNHGLSILHSILISGKTKTLSAVSNFFFNAQSTIMVIPE